MKYQPCSAYISKCNIVNQCSNNHCMFRLRDIYGHTVFAPPFSNINNQVLIRAGVDSPEDREKLGWPTMKGIPGTNCVSFHCDWYKPLKE